MVNYRRCVSLFISSFLFILFASDFGFARELRLGIGFTLPPYVIREGNRGLEVDIIRASLQKEGYSVSFVYLPNLRMPVEFAQGTVDGIVANATYDLELDSDRKGFVSTPTIAYQNVAISMEKCMCGVESVSELVDKSVLAFNNAMKYLDEEFVAMAKANPEYSELADQSLQVRMLYSGRVQVVISDKRIFQWWRKRLMTDSIGESLDFTARVIYSEVFPPAWRHVTFAHQEDRDAFNRGFEELKSSGEFDTIVNSYAGVLEGEEVHQ